MPWVIILVFLNIILCTLLCITYGSSFFRFETNCSAFFSLVITPEFHSCCTCWMETRHSNLVFTRLAISWIFIHRHYRYVLYYLRLSDLANSMRQLLLVWFLYRHLIQLFHCFKYSHFMLNQPFKIVVLFISFFTQGNSWFVLPSC